MATIQNTYTGNGVTTLFAFTFPYLSEADIKVSLDGVDTSAFTLANATTVQMNAAPGNGVAVRVYRETDSDERVATFFTGAPIKASDLNNSLDQAFYLTQEATFYADQADTNAAAAVVTADDAAADAAAAVATANSAAADAATAIATADAAVVTADAAAVDAAAAVVTADAAAVDAATALAAVANAQVFIPVANLAALGALTPSDGEYYELQDATGAEGSGLITGDPGGFVGDAGLKVQLRYDDPPGTFTWLSYTTTDPENRYASIATETVAASAQATANAALPKTGGTMTGAITFAGGQTFPIGGIQDASTSQEGVVQLTDSTSTTSSTLAATATAVKSAYDLANAALPKAGGTITGNVDSSATGYFDLPAGTTAQRPVSPNTGMVRYNTDTNQFEGYGSTWDVIGGGAKGAGGNQVFFENDTNVTANYSITSGKNAVSAGPITIDNGVTVTVPSGSVWSIV